MSRSAARSGPIALDPPKLNLLHLVRLLLLGMGTAMNGSAQQVERETRIPAAPEAGIVEISPEVRGRLGLFPEVEGFVVARLLLRELGGTVLEVESVRGGELLRERRLLSPQELADFRDLLAVRLAETQGTAPLVSEGRGGFVLGHTLLGLGFYGWAVPVVLDLDSARGQVAAYLLTAGATFYLTYRVSSGRSVTEAHRDLSFYGGTRGILAGVLIGNALTDRDESDSRVPVGVGLAGSVAGSAMGFVVAGRALPDPGTAALWGVMGDFGFAAGAAAAYAAGPYAPRTILVLEEDFAYEESEVRSPAAGHLITVAGGVAGLAAGAWLGNRSPYTEGNVGALRSAGILGAQIAATLTWAAVDEERAVVGGALAGGIAGIVAGDRLLRDRRFSGGEGLLIQAGHLAGAATALGLTWLAVEEVDDNPLLYMFTSTAGSLLGAGLVYRALGEGSAPPASLGRAPTRTLPVGRGVSVSIRPENLLLPALPGSRGASAPLLSIHF